VFKQLLGGLQVKPLFSPHELCKLLPLSRSEAHRLHALSFHPGRDALHLSQANGMHFVSGVRHASMVLRRGKYDVERLQFLNCNLRFIVHGLRIDVCGLRFAVFGFDICTLRQAA